MPTNSEVAVPQRSTELAIITPAFSSHLPLLEISAEGVDRYCEQQIKHYIIVSGREYPLFRHLDGTRRRVISVEDVVPLPVFRLPLLVKGREVWVLDWHRPVRGWILQQIIKLCAPEITDADIIVLLDTDVFFVRAFSLESLVRDGRVRLWREPGAGTLEYQMAWNRTASKLLGLPTRNYYGADFEGNLISWRRDVTLEMRARIAAVSGAHWLRSVVCDKRLSEYQLYGVFVQEVLGAQDVRHLPSNDELCLASWRLEEAGDRRQLLAKHLQPYHVAVNIQSNLHLPMAEVRQLVDAAVLLAEGS
jgi:hypothetical protein